MTLPTTSQAERDDIEADITALDSEIKTLGEMILDTEYRLEWLDTGRRPGNKRGIERRAAYQRESLLILFIMYNYGYSNNGIGVNRRKRSGNGDTEIGAG